MATYRVYEATFPFEAREASELSMAEGDTVIVYEKPNGGGWPDPEKWMTGTNERTRETGEFPGTYCKFFEEVVAAPTIVAAEEPPPPVAERALSSPSPEENAPPVPPRKPKKSLCKFPSERERERGEGEGEGCSSS